MIDTAFDAHVFLYTGSNREEKFQVEDNSQLIYEK